MYKTSNICSVTGVGFGKWQKYFCLGWQEKNILESLYGNSKTAMPVQNKKQRVRQWRKGLNWICFMWQAERRPLLISVSVKDAGELGNWLREWDIPCGVILNNALPQVATEGNTDGGGLQRFSPQILKWPTCAELNQICIISFTGL